MPLSSGVPKCPKVSQCVSRSRGSKFEICGSSQLPKPSRPLKSHRSFSPSGDIYVSSFSIYNNIGREASGKDRTKPITLLQLWPQCFAAQVASLSISRVDPTLVFVRQRSWKNTFLRNMCRALFQPAWAGGLRDRERQPELRERRDPSQVPRPTSQSGNLTSDLPEEEKHKLEHRRLQRQIQITRH